MSWIHQNQELFNTANTIFKSNFPQLFEEYSKVLLPNRFFGAWITITLNKLFDTGMSYHIDKQDYKKSYCWVLPFGTFSKGFFNIPEIPTKICLQTRDFLCFDSHLLHGVEPFIGTRYSLVFFSHSNLFT